MREQSLIILSCFFASTVLANSSTSVQKVDRKKETLSFVYGQELERSVREKEGVNKVFSGHSLSASYGVNDYSIGSLLSFDKELTREKESSFRDYILTVSRKAYKSDSVNISLAITNYLPLSDKSKNIDELNYGLKVSAPISWETKISGLVLSSVSGIRKNFHRFETSKNNDPVTSVSLSQRFILAYQISDFFNITADNIYSKNYTYKNNSKDSFYLDQLLEYSLTADTKVGVGHNVGGNTLATDGETNNIKAYNYKTSKLYFNFEYKF